MAQWFDSLGDWDIRYQYLIEFGEQLSSFPPKYRIEKNRVKGCMSEVYIYTAHDSEDKQKSQLS
ncbi:MAG: SufE family protein [gamma proteobacterium endosymbiont of Lamellibrachia anaximandri]|nr:SufE family protein [gamma proteobacterium endosymbiont of Lamellibrachia anaximandri]